MNHTISEPSPINRLRSLPKPAKQAEQGARASVYDLITQRIISLMEAGTVPWKKSWNVSLQWPRNLLTHRPYRGINVFLLLSMCYQSPLWLTFRQANELGGRVRKGEKSCPVVFWKPLEVEGEQKKEQKRQVPVLRVYHLFNLSQCEGLKNIPPLSEQLGTLRKPAEIVERMPQRPVIKQGMTRAFYQPAEDYVGIPYPSQFTSEEEYHCALFHELIHSTGHQSRLNRSSLTESTGFGTDPYCREELVAEIGAAFLCAHAEIAERTVENSAAYIKAWLGRLRSDKKLIVHAAAQAQAAADYILGTTPSENSSPNLSQVAAANPPAETPESLSQL